MEERVEETREFLGIDKLSKEEKEEFYKLAKSLVDKYRRLKGRLKPLG